MASWTKKSAEGAPKGRSSHSVTVLPGTNKVYIYGGEDIPRRAFDGAVHSYDFSTDKWESVEPTKDAPDNRLAHTTSAVKDRLFVFGGRKTHGQSIYDSQEALDLNELYVFNTSNNDWAQIQPSAGSNTPQVRSFHAATSTTDSFVIFGGCSGHDRLNDLWQFHPEKSQWVQIGSQSTKAPPIRGGPALSSVGSTIYLHGGYQGALGEAEDLWVFDTRSNQWQSLNEGLTTEEKPLARSVHSLVNLDGKKLFTWGGEGTASKLGHLGAGEFFGDSWYYDIEERRWRQAESEEQRSKEEQRPSARGWFAMDRLSDKQVVLFGGLDGTRGDERLGDLYVFNSE